MTERKSSFVDINKLQAAVEIETACRFYGIDPGELQRIGRDIRTKCFLNCGKENETGDRAIAIKADSAMKLWRCFEYGCGKGGNLVTLCDLMKEGENCGGKQPMDTRFKMIREDLRQMAAETFGTTPVASTGQVAKDVSPVRKLEGNVPLEESDNERTRQLFNLDEKFIVVPDETMNKDAAAYQRQHPFLTLDVCEEERTGYLPRAGSSGDHRGGSIQGTWAYCYPDEQGRPIAWFGRNLKYEQEHAKWIEGGRTSKEPVKFRFARGFRRGLEVLGQHEWNIEAVQKQIRDEIGALLLVEGPNDRIALKTIGVPAFALCSNTVTSEQAEKSSAKAREIGVPVGVMFDLDREGMCGRDQAILELAKHGPVRDAWNSELGGGVFKGRQPESLSHDEWENILQPLLRDGLQA